MKIKNFTIENSTIECKRPGYIRFVSNWVFRNIMIETLPNEAVTEE